MTRLIRKEVSFEWSANYEVGFLKIKDLVTLASILSFPDKGKGFTIYCDAYGVSLRCVLI